MGGSGVQVAKGGNPILRRSEALAEREIAEQTDRQTDRLRRTDSAKS